MSTDIFKIATYNLSASKAVIISTVTAFVGTLFTAVSLDEIDNNDVLHTDFSSYHLVLVNHENRDILVALMQKFLNKHGETRNQTKTLMTSIEVPISEQALQQMLQHIMVFLEKEPYFFSMDFITDKGMKSIPVSQILYFEFYNRKIKIKTRSDEYMIHGSLHKLVTRVQGFDFYQPHKSFLVNFAHISMIKNNDITMKDNSILPLSQKKAKGFRAAYHAYLASHHLKEAQ